MAGSAAWQEVERQLRRLASEDRFSGSVLVTRGSDTLLECAAGVADRAAGTPVTPATRFGLASLSKMFTAAAVMSCVGAELLAVEDRVAELLPPQRRPRTMAPEVTVHHLLTHTSGIGDYAEEDETLPGYVADYAALWRERPSYAMERPDDFLPLYADAPPVSAPGAEFHYCNAGYVLLGTVLEQVTGSDFVSVVRDRVLRPAGMESSGYFRLDEAVPDCAVGYLPPGPPDDSAPWRSNVFSVPVVGGGDGGAFATARDVDRFLRSLASGELLGPAVTERMLSRHTEEGEGIWMGYGVFLRPEGFGHGGGDPGVEVLSRHLPGQDVSLVVLCNGEGTVGEAWGLVQGALTGSA